jgi:hypothetical protein
VAAAVAHPVAATSISTELQAEALARILAAMVVTVAQPHLAERPEAARRKPKMGMPAPQTAVAVAVAALELAQLRSEEEAADQGPM